MKITASVFLDEQALDFSFIRSPGPGGQNVNKVATVVLLRFNIRKADCLPDIIKTRLLSQLASRLTASGDLLIKATRYRSQERNKQDAIERLVKLLADAAIQPKLRKKTKPTRSSVEKRIKTKKQRSKIKGLRQNKPED